MIWTQYGKYLLFLIYQPFRIKKGKCSGLYLSNQYISKMIFIPFPVNKFEVRGLKYFPAEILGEHAPITWLESS